MKILVVDDDPSARLVVEVVAEELGHQCFSADNGKKAWQLFGEVTPDVVVSDRAMPGLDGLELCRRIRAVETGTYAYLVLLTEYGEPADVLEGMHAGADDCLTKPLDPFELQARLMAARRVTALHAELTHSWAEQVRQANTDALTGLASRAAFDVMLPRMLARRGPDGRGSALLLADLDAFKAVNDRYGHRVGDQLLRVTAERLTALVRDADLVARLGGDEFAVIVDDTDVRGAIVLAGRITEALGETAELGDISVTPRASVGVYIPDGQVDAGQALVCADMAMYTAKYASGGHQLYDAERHRSIIERYDIELDLRAAPARGEMVLHYQPIVDLATRQILGVEALVRWNHPTRGVLEPDAFIEVAEESGAIVDLGRWVLAQGCADTPLFLAVLPEGHPFTVAVNLSRRQLSSHTLVDDVSDALHSNGLTPERLVLEVTETALMQDADAMISLLHKLKSLGVELAMDDFGTGYSSLAQLRTMPIDVLKIDKAFVDGIASDDEEWALATAIIRLARSLGKRTLAEGVEHPAQLAHLRSLGCEWGQGYLFARPKPLDEVLRLLAEQHPGPPPVLPVEKPRPQR